MVDKMMRIAGRGEDGLAKAISTDNEGRVKLHPEDGKKVILLDTAQKVIPAKGRVQFVVNGDYDGIEFSFRLKSKFSCAVSVDEYFTAPGNPSNLYMGNKILMGVKERLSGTIKTRVSGNRLEFNIINHTDVEQTLLGVYISSTNLIVDGSGSDSKLFAENKQGVRVPLTTEEDTQGKSALRVVDAAPFAYDRLLDVLRVKEPTNVNHLIKSMPANTPLPAKQYAVIDTNIDLSNFKEIMITMRTSKAIPFTLVLQYHVGASSYGYEDNITATMDSFFYTTRIPVKSGMIASLRIRNDSETNENIVGMEIRGLR